MNLPRTLDYLADIPRDTKVGLLRSKEPEVEALRHNAGVLIQDFKKETYGPSPQEREWIFWDYLIGFNGGKEKVMQYLTPNLQTLLNLYPWEICHWSFTFYKCWNWIRFTAHIPLPEADGLLYYSLTRPFPNGFNPPAYRDQEYSLHKILVYLHRYYTRLKSNEAVKEISSNLELLDALLSGEILPYKYIEILPYSLLYDKVTKYLLSHPSAYAKVPETHKKGLEVLRSTTGTERELLNAPWLQIAARLHKQGLSQEEIYGALQGGSKNED